MKEITQVGIAVGMGLDGTAMDGELQISGGKSEGEPRIVANSEGLIELVGYCVEKGGVRSSRNGGVDDGEGDCTVLINKNFEGNRKT